MLTWLGEGEGNTSWRCKSCASVAASAPGDSSSPRPWNCDLNSEHHSSCKISAHHGLCVQSFKCFNCMPNSLRQVSPLRTCAWTRCTRALGNASRVAVADWNKATQHPSLMFSETGLECHVSPENAYVNKVIIWQSVVGACAVASFASLISLTSPGFASFEPRKLTKRFPL